jgi:formamidopyrimidine-DNA glycosylase
LPELPDVAVYIEAIAARITGRKLARVRVANPFLLRTVAPPLSDLEGRTAQELRRIGKRIAIGFEGDLWLVVHLMIAGRLHWRPAPAKLAGRNALAALDFENGSLTLTEAGSERRAQFHVLGNRAALATLDAGGIDVMAASAQEFANALTRTNHTLKRALTDPHIFDGIGNAFSDEILHRARLSPITLTQKLKPEEIERLHEASRVTLTEWTDLLRTQAAGKFPEKVTAFRPEMKVHGKFGQVCADCGAKVQRIRYASNETNYCPRCQTGGRLLADRSLSRLLREDWPRTID